MTDDNQQVKKQEQETTQQVQQDTSVTTASQAQTKKASCPTILLIEDDPLLSKMYTAKFTNEGFKVLVAGDGEVGLRIALDNKPNLILLDIMMPKLSGLDLMAKLRQDEWGRSVPVLILTNLTQQSEAQKAMKLGAKEFLVKANFTPSQVVEKVKKYTD